MQCYRKRQMKVRKEESQEIYREKEGRCGRISTKGLKYVDRPCLGETSSFDTQDECTAVCLTLILMSRWLCLKPLLPFHSPLYSKPLSCMIWPTCSKRSVLKEVSVYAKHTRAYQGLRPHHVLSFIGSPVESACVTFPAVCLYPPDSSVYVCVCISETIWAL